ncbi:uncharacterized protein LOC122248974 isoform X2 [Penaeus japonicus]|uniref:uncharacterized protein LOC122248974 isoform X2 n=1 Tax=Penaeus japonicus TaxID=27405 RepID=UPI001C710D30|nr:uncharacterized protein LOC122248974 isoform X2 [Penaeus japonicus]
MAAGITQLSYLLVVCMVALGFMAMRSQIQEIRDAVHENGRSDAGGKVSIVERSLNRTKQLIDNIYCSIADVLPSGGFCLTDKHIFTGHNEAWDGKLCGALEDLFGYASVADFGAGLGHYGRCFLRYDGNFLVHGNDLERASMIRFQRQQMRKANLDQKPQVIRSWKGFDGAANIEKMTDGKIKELELGKPVDLGTRFDWVMSIEVGEHIPAENEDVFMDNLVKHACKGVVLSWAVPGQPGHHHINNRRNDYIINKMEKRGMIHDQQTQTHIRTVIYAHWLKNTLMVFRFPNEKC